MDLSPEDSLRLNVLLANKPQAIRIDESRLIVYGLTDQTEAKIQLNPTCRDEVYVKHVKELISGHVLGSPGGYPVYLHRWTRMGQMKDESLEQLLLLGEPEAIIAAVCAQGLTDELAKRAWWAMEDAGNARQMLAKKLVCEGEMGPILASYLVEHLPFESEPEKQIETIRLVLQPNLLDEEQCAGLWRKALRKPAYYVGFLSTRADSIPESEMAHPFYDDLLDSLTDMAGQGNVLAQVMKRVFSSQGQAYLQTVFRIYKKPSNQEVVNITLDEIADYFSLIREAPADETFSELEAEAHHWLNDSPFAQDICTKHPELRDAVIAVRVLSGLGYGVVRPIFCDSTAIGSLMRKKITPVMDDLYRHLHALSARQA